MENKILTDLQSSWKLNGYCWEWTGARNGCGYGTLGKYLVHRLSYALFKSNFRRQQFICHHCDNRICYNPGHLYEGDYRSNGRDAAIRRRTYQNRLYKAA